MLKEARNDFVRVVSETVTRLMHEHGYSRDRATSLLLREIAAGQTPENNEDDGSKVSGIESSCDNEELNWMRGEFTFILIVFPCDGSSHRNILLLIAVFLSFKYFLL